MERVWLLLVYANFLLCMNFLRFESITILSNETDRKALIAFKDRITGIPLGPLSTWNDTLHFCKWEGVKCGRRHQRVIALDLESQSLTGSISPSITNLTFLRTIRLPNNSLYGVIPQEFGQLFQVRYLNLSMNSLGGEIPVTLSNCSELRVIDLTFNKITGRIPIELTTLQKLQYLYSSANRLTGIIPSTLGNLSALARLSLARNSFEGSIPNEVGRISNLEFLQISQNNLSGTIPPAIYNLSSLFFLSVAQKQLHGDLPSELGNFLPRLQMLYVGGNGFTGPIPASISNASGLLELYFVDNYFTGPMPQHLGRLQDLRKLNVGRNLLGTMESNDLEILDSLINCTRLELLSIDGNQLSGILPNSIANLSTELRFLTMGVNQITGSIPTGIANLAKLNLLAIERTFLEGIIPTEVGKLQNLQMLALHKNRFSGPIPYSIGNNTQLNKLYLQGNGLQGSIPPTLGNCRYLQELDLSQNNLSGTIPKQVIGLSSLSVILNLSHNSFSGSLPVEVGDLINLSELDISMNKISGEIPSTLSSCVSLKYLHMGSNMFEGVVTLSLSTLRGMEDLDLSHNNLDGRIPWYLGKFSFLQYLNLSYNDLEGEVPQEGIFQNTSAFSIIGNSKLCGGIVELQLPPCPVQAIKKPGWHHALKVVIPIITIFVCLMVLSCCFVAILRKRKSINRPSIESVKDHHLVSYAMLHKATEGFSSTHLVGVGSYGSVYRGKLDHNEQDIAVKVFNLQKSGSSKSFMTECTTSTTIRHRNLIRILTSCSSIDFKGNAFKAIIYEFMPNGSLEEWLHPKLNGNCPLRHFNLSQRLNIAIDVACALDYLHHDCAETIAHCDLKPSNVLLDDDMTAHLGDFGLARFIPKNTNRSLQDPKSIDVKGTIGYVAPEYGTGSTASTKGDMYSYGILMLEMFTGKRPTDEMFKDGSSLHTFAKMAWPARVMEIADTLLLKEGDEKAMKIGGTNVGMKSRIMRECLTSVLDIGISCSLESPRERMEMRDVILEMHTIKDSFVDGFSRKMSLM